MIWKLPQSFQCDGDYTRKHQFNSVYVLWGQKSSGMLEQVIITRMSFKSGILKIFVHHLFRVEAENFVREKGKGPSFWMVRLRWSSVHPHNPGESVWFHRWTSHSAKPKPQESYTHCLRESTMFYSILQSIISISFCLIEYSSWEEIWRYDFNHLGVSP